MPDIFVFGSNREGRHGAGAARTARLHHGAIYGRARGRQGNSYAIVTKELRPDQPPVRLLEIRFGVIDFLSHAAKHPHDTFWVTKIGCGLAGFTEAQIGPLFKGAPPNVMLPEPWEQYR